MDVMVYSPRPPPLVEQDIPPSASAASPSPQWFCALLPAASPPPTVRASSGSPLGTDLGFRV